MPRRKHDSSNANCSWRSANCEAAALHYYAYCCKNVRVREDEQWPTLGWCEWVGLPLFSPVPIKAKIDTGARTSSLHAENLKLVTIKGGIMAEFEMHPVQRTAETRILVSVPVTNYKQIRSSSGHVDRRPVVRTNATVGDHNFEIDVTLADRSQMKFPMLLGRSALAERFLVDASKPYLMGRK